MRRTHFFLALAGLTGLVSCSRSPSEPTATAAPSAGAASSSAAAAPAPPPTIPAEPPSSAKPALALQWDDPPRWQRRKPSSPMRAAEYVVPHAAGDTDDAECTVFTFGPGQGGSVDDNIERWVKQLEPTTGIPARTNRSVHGLTISRVDVSGTFTPMKMPGGPPAQGPREGWRLLGLVVETPSGPWFFKVTGPSATVKGASKELDTLIDSLRTH